MDRAALRRDVRVAAVAATTAVAATVVVEFLLDLDVSLLVRAAPLYVYFLYSFTRKGGPYTQFDTPQTWMGLAVAAGLVVVGYGLVG